MSRPAEMDEEEDYRSPYWPGGVITGTVASGFTVDMTGTKKMHIVPSSVWGFLLLYPAENAQGLDQGQPVRQNRLGTGADK